MQLETSPNSHYTFNFLESVILIWHIFKNQYDDVPYNTSIHDPLWKFAPVMEAASTFEKMVNFYYTKHNNTREDSHHLHVQYVTVSLLSNALVKYF
jgi:hypothetical protein